MNRLQAAAAVCARAFAIDTRALAAFRVGVGLLVLGDLIDRARDLSAFYTDGGVFPREALAERSHDFWANYLFVYYYAGSPAAVAALFAITALCACALVVGYRTRVATVLTWYLAIALQARCTLILNGGDDYLRMLLFWGMFLPLGARFSFDAYRRPFPAAPRVITSVGTVALILQVMVLYVFTALLKSDPAWRLEGSAVYLALAVGQYQTSVGKWIFELRQMWLLRLLTWATISIEGVGPVFALLSFLAPRLRIAVVAAFLIFHQSLNLLMDVGALPYISTVAWIPFLPTLFWDTLENRARVPLATVRARLSALAGPPRPPRRQTPRALSILWQGAAAVFLYVIVFWNLRTVDFDRYALYLPARFNPIADVFRIDQRWAMFAPKPMTDDGWFVQPGQLTSGETVDLFHGNVRGPVNPWRRPAITATDYKNERWRKFYMTLWNRREERERYWWGRWVCRTYNAGKTEKSPDALQNFHFYFVMRATLPAWRTAPPERVQLWEHFCYQLPKRYQTQVQEK